MDVGTYIVKGMYRNRALLDLAHGFERCQNCGRFTPEGCEPGHSNEPEHGKAVGQKGHDCHFAALCVKCHRWYDNQGGYGKDPSGLYDATREGKRAMFTRAQDNTMRVLWSQGKVRLA